MVISPQDTDAEYACMPDKDPERQAEQQTYVTLYLQVKIMRHQLMAFDTLESYHSL